MKRVFTNEEFGSITTLESTYKPMTLFPKKNTHPRVMFTADMIPGIKAALDNPLYKTAADAFWSHANADCDGVLGEPVENFKNRKGVHNFDCDIIATIESKALAYQLTGERRYADEALYAMKNFMLTLRVPYITSDQCREYGLAMFTAAKVYDWCFDILTEDDKYQLMAGVETKLCQGYVEDEAWVEKWKENGYIDPIFKMEVGFPPTRQGAVVGHGAEAQVMRDYLAMAIAIYDEKPDWWEFIGGRVMDEYVAFRNEYFPKTGIPPQGISCYAKHRHFADLYSAWLFKIATGTNPYLGMDETVRSIAICELPDKRRAFGSGDGTSLPLANGVWGVAIIAAALNGDATLRAAVRDFTDNYTRAFDCNSNSGSNMVPFLIFSSVSPEPAESRYEGYPTILYNGGYLAQYTTRARWNDENAPATFMKMGVRSSANHEHDDAGTFLIYYKGALSTPGGCYNNYGHYHNQYFHQATVSHNGILVYNPAYKDDCRGWYSGSQRYNWDAGATLESWLEKDNAFGTLISNAEGYKDEARTESDFAYLAGDIANAYPAGTVERLERRMLTVYTDDPDFPLAFFTYDDIVACDKDFKKSFLLQINATEAPTVSGNTVMTENEGGRLVLTSLIDSPVITPLGGRAYREDGRYDPDNSTNYLINGVNCRTLGGVDDKHWGRVEISPAAASERDKLLHAIYVTDRDSDKPAPKVERIDAVGAIGARIGKTVALFVESFDVKSVSVELGEGESVCYLSGLKAGKWQMGDTTLEVKAGAELVKITASGSLALTYKN